MTILNTEAITLRRRRTREADALVTLWGRSCGKIVASTRSVLKSSSRYAGVTQPFHRLQAILYAQNEEQEIWTLTQVSLLESYETIQNDLNRMSYASMLVEWIDALSGEFQSSERIWYLLIDILQRWNQKIPKIEELLYYQLHLLIDAGFQPLLGSCSRCQRSQTNPWYYVTQEGRFYCSSCRDNGLEISGGAVEIMRRLSESHRINPAIRMSPQQMHEIQRLLAAHAAYHVGLQSRAVHFQEDLQKIRPDIIQKVIVNKTKGSSS